MWKTQSETYIFCSLCDYKSHEGPNGICNEARRGIFSAKGECPYAEIYGVKATVMNDCIFLKNKLFKREDPDGLKGLMKEISEIKTEGKLGNAFSKSIH